MAVTDYASLSETDRIAYDANLKVDRDNASCLSFARKYGIEEGKLDVAKVMKADGLSVETIQKYTGLSPEEIEKL